MTVYTIRVLTNDDIETALRRTGWTQVLRVPALGPCWEWDGAKLKRGGYGQVSIAGKGGRKVHRLAYALWVGEIPAGLWVLHRCDNPPCLRPSHLFVGTVRDNVRDMRAKGRGFDIPAAPGEQSPSAKLTYESVDEIRALLAADRHTLQEIGDRYGVTKQAIWRLKTGKTWKTSSTT